MLKLAVSIFGGTSSLFASRLLFQISFAYIYGIEIYGYFALAQSILLLIEKLKNFQPWQQLTVDIANAESKELVFWTFFLYECVVSIFSYGVFLVVFLFFMDSLGGELKSILIYYSLYLMLCFNGSALGYLRWRAEYKYVFISHICASSLICTVSFFAYWLSWMDAVYAYITVEFIFFISLNVVAILKVGRADFRKICGFMAQRIRGHMRIIKVAHSNNIVRSLTRELDVVVLGLLASSSIVGTYKMAKNIAHLPVFITDAFYYSIYPELVRLCADRLRFNILLRQSTVNALIFSFVTTLVFLIFLCSAYALDIKQEFFDVVIMAAVFQFPISICIVTFSWAPGLISLGKQHELLKANVWATIVYFCLFYPLYITGGAIGVILNYGVYYVVWALIIWRPLWRW